MRCETSVSCCGFNCLISTICGCAIFTFFYLFLLKNENNKKKNQFTRSIVFAFSRESLLSSKQLFFLFQKRKRIFIWVKSRFIPSRVFLSCVLVRERDRQKRKERTTDKQKSNESMTRYTKAWELFPGKNKFYCNGRILTTKGRRLELFKKRSKQ